MAAFYARYVPATNPASIDPPQERPKPIAKKRKLEVGSKESNTETKKSKIATNGTHSPSKGDQKGQGLSSRSLSPTQDAHIPNGVHGAAPEFQPVKKNGTQVNGDPTHEKPKRRKKTKIGELDQQDFRLHSPVPSFPDEECHHVQQTAIADSIFKEKDPAKRRKGKKGIEVVDLEPQGSDGDQLQSEQHTSIRSKFKKATKPSVRSSDEAGQREQPEEREVSELKELHGLEPLPQPPQTGKPSEVPSFSSLPPWLARPLRVDPSESVDFKDLGLDAALLENIERQGLTKAFAVQSAVVPLLLDGVNRHHGDVCISAATGSGKTLAYVLPLMQKMRKLATTELRALIVVPTRDLVKQAQETCEACSAGTNVKISTALGSKTLSDEQEALVERYEVWDPEEYQTQQNALVDWSKTTIESMMDEEKDKAEVSPNFVVKYRSKVDVLICTPGRLVDHLRSTKGFTLDDVQWLVIDEADRLLNESFQEWTDVVLPALEDRTSSALQDRILNHMRLELPARVVQKVMLSATMTRDVSKLKSLKLQNPKLVLIGASTAHSASHMIEGPDLRLDENEAGAFHLPSTLAEYAVPIGDGGEKPLFLLELLRKRIDIFDLQSGGDEQSAKEAEDDTSSDSDSSDSDPGSPSSSSTLSSSRSVRRDRKPIKQKAIPSLTDSTGKNNTALIFTRSTESAMRLSRLLSLLSKPIASLTATLTKTSTKSSSSRKALADLRQGKIRIIIATDRASRGLDLPELGHVISYDVPTNVTTYVHRVGRTARAGKSGKAWTLLAHREARWFWNEIGKVGGEELGKEGRIVRNCKVQRCQLKLNTGGESQETKARYEKALKQLGEEVVGETSSRPTTIST